MALTATDTIGFEPVYNKAGFPANPIEYEGSSGTAYVRGSILRMANGLAATVTYATTPQVTHPIIGVCAESKTLTTADRFIKVWQPDGQVFKVTFAHHKDMTSYGTTTASIFRAATGTADLWGIASTVTGLKALLYIYEGPGKGDTRVVTQHTSGADSTLNITVSSPFSAYPTSDSKAIVLAGSTGLSYPTNVGSLLALSSDSNLQLSALTSAVAGCSYAIVQSVDMANLTMDIMFAPSKTINGIGIANATA